jgi:glycosyltransferase involved in cell wall biosynthesis
MVEKVSILVPAFNEAEGITATLERLAQVGGMLACSCEVVVIDDGSTDGTRERVEDFIAAHTTEVRIRIARHDCNRGYGAALKTGLREAGGDAIVIIDADLTYPPDRIPELVAGLDSADMVVGARVGDRVHIPAQRRPAKWVLSRLAERVAGRKIPDLNSGLRAFHKHLADRYFHLFPNGFSFTTTITLAAMCDDYRVCFVPIDYAKRSGKSKIRPVQDTFNFIILIVRMAAYFEPLRVFLPASFVSGLVAAALLVFYFIKEQGISDAGVLACVVTLLIFMMGILADLVVRRTRR